MAAVTDRQQTVATGFGLVAILLWSSLASVAAAVAAIPPFELVALSFTLSTVAGLGWAAVSGERLVALRRVPWSYWLLGVYGLFGYHAAYFYALQNAPAVEANLINYLWPLLIVVLSALLPRAAGGRPLRWWHFAGAMLGFAGTAVIVAGVSGGPSAGGGWSSGYLAAFAAALIWSTYSVASRLHADVPSLAVMGTSAATAVAATATSLATESWVWPSGATQWLAIVFQGLGPVGVAFYLWDRAMKRGHLRLVGIASYATPLLSTLLLVTTGMADASPLLWLAAVLVTIGAALGGGDLWLAAPRRGRSEQES